MLVGVLAWAPVPGAWAAVEQTQVEATPGGEAVALETVMVTAQKRTENIQQVPISVSAVTAQEVESAHTVNLEALSGAIPVPIGHFSNTPTSAVFNIRGMGVIEPDPCAGQTVTVVVDGIPQSFNMISLSDLFDIERIEILRGPQGTPFGANTTGVVVNIITAQPTGRYEARATGLRRQLQPHRCGCRIQLPHRAGRPRRQAERAAPQRGRLRNQHRRQHLDGRLRFWVRNIADKHYIASVYDVPGTLGLVNYEPPREFGFTVNFHWE